jgi:sugar-specific transcriptional regulator TrmB
MEMASLQEAGLTGNEEKVYLALLDLGPSMAGQVSRRTGLHRRSVYDVLDVLIKKGMVGYILKNNRRLYQAGNPGRIIELLDEKKENLQNNVDQLLLKYNKTVDKEETNFYKGKDGLKNIFEDQLNYKEVLILGASPKAYEVLKFYFKWYDKSRQKKKIKSRIIATDKKIKKIPLSEIRYLPEKYSNPVAVNIYGDKTAIILWADRPIAIVIKNKDIALGYRQYFELMWNVARK